MYTAKTFKAQPIKTTNQDFIEKMSKLIFNDNKKIKTIVLA